jgi:hypothetical protein
MTPTHAFTLSGQVSIELKDTRRPLQDEIRHRLQMLDGQQRYSLVFWAIPDGVPFDRVDVDAVGEYLQCAGSAQRMTVEMRHVDDSGVAHHVVIGRPGPADGDGAARDDPDEVVPWDGHEARVHPHEVFDAAEAGELFVSYYETGDVPASYARRPIEL